MIFNVKHVPRYSPHANEGMGGMVTETTTITADYFRVEGGALIFRNSPRGREEFPHPVHVFAAGIWAEIETETGRQSHATRQTMASPPGRELIFS